MDKKKPVFFKKKASSKISCPECGHEFSPAKESPEAVMKDHKDEK